MIGVPDEKRGEAVEAVVVRRDGAAVGDAELITWVRERKGPVYTPKSVDFVAELSLTQLGKPDKKQVRARYWPQSDRQVN